ncbi:Putative ribonuclease H protein At1g65750 [Linum perenne]
MSPPRTDAGEDILVWGLEDNGSFSVKSAYALLKDFRLDEQNGQWQKVWKWQGSFSEIAWTPAEQGWATINTDGSVLRNPTRAAAGGIVRRDDGRSLGAFVANLGSCSVTRAELRGAVLGLEMAWALDCRRVELQLDSRAPVALLSRDGIQDHQHTLEVMAFQELCRREWVVSIRHVYREANRAADFLANRGHVFPYGVHHFPIVDCNLNYVLLYDSLGVSNPRLIAVND